MPHGRATWRSKSGASPSRSAFRGTRRTPSRARPGPTARSGVEKVASSQRDLVRCRARQFFGIIGRNGSGKSTLLKLLAGIYKADAGRIRIAPRVAPVIELGVGFQQELPAWHNVVLNAEMIGLTTEEARARFDTIIHFAELEDFVDLKLKNYSSGMRMRLAFAIAMEMDADVLLLDEVGAVGDAVFKKKSQQVFAAVRDDPAKTLVLVTHGLGQVERFCGSRDVDREWTHRHHR